MSFPEFSNQEKGVLAKGVSAESSVTPKETKNTIGPSTTFGTQSENRQERRTFLQKPLKDCETAGLETGNWKLPDFPGVSQSPDPLLKTPLFLQSGSESALGFQELL